MFILLTGSSIRVELPSLAYFGLGIISRIIFHLYTSDNSSICVDLASPTYFGLGII